MLQADRTMTGRTLHTAAILLPMTDAADDGGVRRRRDVPVLRDAGVLLDADGTIVEIGPIAGITSGFDVRVDHALLVPGLLNCHVHLIDAGRSSIVPGGQGLNAWVRGLLAARGAEEGAVDLDAAVLATLAEMRAAGTVAVGEVANSYTTLAPIARSGMRCRFIHELLAFPRERALPAIASATELADAEHWPPNVAHTLAAHAPYSVSPELMRAIVEWTGARGLNFHQHLAEDPAERELYERGSGPWREFLERVGAWEPSWEGTERSPVEFYDTIGLLNERFVAVHLANATSGELALLAGRGARAILSPASNLHITGLLPDLETIVRVGMRFAFGTDGRGSNASVDVIDEARLLFERFPDLRPGAFLRALTADAAAILQFPDLGALRPGTAPGLLAVAIGDVTDDLTRLEAQILTAPASRRALL